MTVCSTARGSGVGRALPWGMAWWHRRRNGPDAPPRLI